MNNFRHKSNNKSKLFVIISLKHLINLSAFQACHIDLLQENKDVYRPQITKRCVSFIHKQNNQLHMIMLD